MFNSTHVQLRTDRIRKLLEAPYSGLYKFIERHDKFFIMEAASNTKQTVSIIQLKPVTFSQIHTNDKNAKQNPSTDNDNRTPQMPTPDTNQQQSHV